MNLDIAGFTHPGNYKSVNEDRISVLEIQTGDESLHVLTIADGMGGHKFPDKAAEIFVEAVEKTVLSLNQAIPEPSQLINSAYLLAYQDLKENFPEHIKPAPGCATVMAVIQKNTVTIGWIGDCRAYAIQDKSAIQLTKDHSEVERLIAQGQLTKEEAETSLLKHVLSWTVMAGSDNSLPEIIVREFHKNQYLLLCSDGLSNEIANTHIAFFFDFGKPEYAVKKSWGKPKPAENMEESNATNGIVSMTKTGNLILDAVLSGQAKDNVSFILCSFA